MELAGTAAGGAAGAALATATGNPEMIPVATSLGGYAGSQLAKASGNAIFGSGMKHRGRPRKGAPSKTHPHELDYTTKKGDKDYHINHHDVFEPLLPYTHYRKHIKGGSNIASPNIAESITGGKMKKNKSTKTSSWISHIKEYAKKHGMNYAQALSDPSCRSSYHSR